jgi:5-oxopent-3-ene-1,2,5-tricarboxylate decarboxylase/2-hydroxyhepta-2,4-diene-1,7-dioate isomerase
MQMIRTAQHPWQPRGTVYGTLLNFHREWDLWAPRMDQDPHKGAPKAPVLYIKTANTFSPAGQDVLLQDGVTEVDIGATLGLVIGDDGQVAGGALLCDWSVPHASYYRPPVKFRCRDGFLSLPEQVTPFATAAAWSPVQIETRRNGDLVQTTRLADLKRPIAQLLADVGEFMTLQPGDVLMVGTDCLADGTRPRAKTGDRVEISAPGFASVVVQVGGAA